MADSKFSKIIQGDEISGKQIFAVSGQRFDKLCQHCSAEDNFTEADNWCVNCSELLCSACSEAHTRLTMFRDHRIIAAGEVNNVTVSYDMKGIDQCQQHNEQLKFLCEDDDQLCCSTCAIVKHRKCHSVVEIEYTAKTKVPELTNIKQELLDIDFKTNAYAQRLMNIKVKIATDATEITNKIQDMQDKVNEMFENLKTSVANDAHAFQQKVQSNLDLKNDVCNNYITDLTNALSDVDSVRQLGTPAQQLIVAHHLKDRVKTLRENTVKDIAELKDIHMSFDFYQSIHLPPTNNATPGKLTMKYVPADVTMYSDSMNGQQKDHTVKLTLLASVALKKNKGDQKEPLYSGLDFLPDGRLVAVDNKNKKCLVYNQILEKVGSVLFPYSIYDVTVITDEDAAVSSGPRIYLIKICKLSEITITSTLNTTMNCVSLCMMKDDDLLVGCRDDPQPVRVVSVGGEEKTLAINFPSKQYKPDDSTCTYIKNCNKVVISDRLAQTVYIYDQLMDTRVDVSDETIQGPRGMAVGPADCIFVCSTNTNSVVQVSHIGQILSSHVLDMKQPRSVCVSTDNTRLAVSNDCSGKKKLQLYYIELI